MNLKTVLRDVIDTDLPHALARCLKIDRQGPMAKELPQRNVMAEEAPSGARIERAAHAYRARRSH